ncbi:TLDc domain-containing protein [Oxytricha trifallax]|uniref:TLDc domain-containing protein n=1 Tax=Oxytricha trifallax TaxID=1172189 RepID=A0A073HZX1_9SPIT|nr:TLDc domain-containing protein [Oxytricha trifallax]
MESFTKCDLCQNAYNLNKHKPIILPDCFDTVCLECAKTQLPNNLISENQYKCCLDQSHIINLNINDLNKLPVNPLIKKNLEKQSKNLEIYCNEHKNMREKYYIKDLKLIVCKKCLHNMKEDIINQKHTVRKINQENFNEYLNSSLDLHQEALNVISSEIHNIKQLQEQPNNLDQSSIYEMFEKNDTIQNMVKLLSLDANFNNDEDLACKSFPLYSKFHQPQDNEVEVFIPQKFSLVKRTRPTEKEFWQFSFYNEVNIEILKRPDSFLKHYLPKWRESQYKLLYQASVNGYAADKFHELCDNRGPTVTFYLSENGKSFGIYAYKSWESPAKATFQFDSELFIFQLDLRTVHKQIRKGEKLQYLNKSYFPSAGSINEFDMRTHKGINIGQTTNFGQSFDVSNIQKYGQISNQNYLGGSANFDFLEIEVYSFN